MNREFVKFGENIIDKQRSYSSKGLMAKEDVDIDKMLISEWICLWKNWNR